MNPNSESSKPGMANDWVDLFVFGGKMNGDQLLLGESSHAHENTMMNSPMPVVPLTIDMANFERKLRKLSNNKKLKDFNGKNQKLNNH